MHQEHKLRTVQDHNKNSDDRKINNEAKLLNTEKYFDSDVKVQLQLDVIGNELSEVTVDCKKCMNKTKKIKPRR